jgi:hypothetical protein
LTTQTGELHPITMEELRELAELRAAPIISLFFPTQRAIVEPEQNALALKSLLPRVQADLESRHIDRKDVESLLQPLHDLLNDRNFWLHQLDGLAIYRTSDDLRVHLLPVRVDEAAFITDAPVLTPLLKALSGHTEFHVLALSKNNVRLLHCSRHNVREIDLSMLDIPLSFDEAMRYDDFEKKGLQHRPMSAAPAASRNTSQGADFGFHGHGSEEDHKRQILRYFQAVDPGISKILESSGTPLILAAVDYLHPIYKEASSYQRILDEGVEGNPDELRPEELLERAVPVFEEEAQRDLAALEERYGDLAAHGRASSDLADIIDAAYAGRIDTLIIEEGAEEWGTYDPAQRSLKVVGEPGPADVHLYDLAARQTILTSGTLQLMERGKLPGGGRIAALFRY